MGTYLHFWWRVAPTAVRLWAEAEGYEIVTRRNAGVFDWIAFAKGSGHHIYRVVVVDKLGQTLGGVVRVGKPYWWCLSVSKCPVEAYWDLKTRGTLEHSGVRLRWGLSVTDRTVFWFAVADLVLAALVLAMELPLLIVLAAFADEISHGSLGVNHYFGRVPRPEMIGESRMVFFQSMAWFVVLLAALVTLTLGGIGLIRRKWWGYYAHVAGSSLIAVTCFGLFYTIPALTFARRPEFKEYFFSSAKAKSAPREFEDL
jgi:hypothetical protein